VCSNLLTLHDIAVSEDDGEVITPVDQATTSKKEYAVPSRELDMSDHDFLQEPEPAHVDKSYISAEEVCLMFSYVVVVFELCLAIAP